MNIFLFSYIFSSLTIINLLIGRICHFNGFGNYPSNYHVNWTEKNYIYNISKYPHEMIYIR